MIITTEEQTFRPITLTLETPQDVLMMLNLFNISASRLGEFRPTNTKKKSILLKDIDYDDNKHYIWFEDLARLVK